GYVANFMGYDRIYDLDLLTKVQVAFVPVLKDLDFPLIFFYLPAFVLPFQAFALLPPVLSFLLWSLLNFLALVLYLAFFARKASASEKGLLVMLLLSLPVFYNFFWGQVNVWLVICVGEFMRALWEDRPWKAGAWLAGLLLKPQTLVLILPALVLARKFRVIVGFVLTFLALLLLSWLISGPEGFKGMLSLWLKAGTYGFETGVKCMMNWRALGMYLDALAFPLGRVVAGFGMAFTAALVLYLWVGFRPRDEKAISIPLLGTIAGTMAFTWHSHYHTAMLLLPPLISLAGVMPSRLMRAWVLAPPVTLFMVYVTGALFVLAGGTLPESFGCPIFLVLFLVLHLWLLLWAVEQKRKAIGSQADAQACWG
ncbi:MAG: glycosyltransferase family 87 protein, partial [Anaerolineae bacterium]|nr:glycosyltransferase family 87 protein [Anaerolineae bacterium]